MEEGEKEVGGGGGGYLWRIDHGGWNATLTLIEGVAERADLFHGCI